MKIADIFLIKYVQGRCFKEEMAALQLGNCVAKSSLMHKLDRILDNGVLIVGGRLKHAPIPSVSRRPTTLPYNHRLSELIVQEYHSVAHYGKEWTVSELRKKYWIRKARNLVKKVKWNCMICKRLHGSAMQQKMADLPPEQCTPGKPPFTFVGVDIFGPFYVKQGRSEVKRYGCLYACFNSRAIHLEVLNSLEADSFINSFIHFTSRRGYPKKIWSNNGTNLVGAQAELSRSLQDKVISAACRKEVDWILMPLRHPIMEECGNA